MTPEQTAGIQLLAMGAVGFIWQWVLFAPKKVPNWIAWGTLGIATVVVYWWANPFAGQLFHENWRLSLFGMVTFLMAAKGFGSGAKAVGVAPATNSLGHGPTAKPEDPIITPSRSGAASMKASNVKGE